jgi:simple sugar transport system ATP-binding protein
VSETVLELTGIRKRFGSVQALAGVDFRCERGRVHALLGENGAGKSTLMQIVSGLYVPDAGEIRLGGTPVVWRSPEEARRAGIAMVHQHFMLVPTMTIAENVALARGDRGIFRAARLAEDVAHLASERRLAIGDPGRIVGELSVGEQQRVEILKALVGPTRVLILDEPTAVLTPDEVRELFGLLRDLAAAGTAIVIVTHKLAEALSLADHVTVLRQGRVVGGGPAQGFDHVSLAALMIDAPAADTASRAATVVGHEPSAAPVLVVDHVSAEDARGVRVLDDVSLRVARGRIVVVAGVEGNGQTELVEVVAGVASSTLRRLRGVVTIDGRPVRTPADAREAGLAVVPPDRQRDGIVGPLALWENLLLACDELRATAPRGWLARDSEIRRADARLRAFGVRPPDPTLPVASLSGGNQQRVVLARELGRGRLCAMVAANPTRGLDLAATAAVHGRLRELAASGVAIVVLSTDLDEVAALAGDVHVLYRGRLLGPLPASASRLEIGRLMAGLGEAA